MQPIQVKRRVAGAAGGPPTLLPGQPAYNATGQELFIGDGTAVQTLVSAARQVELVGAQTITGAKTIDVANLKLTGGVLNNLLQTDGAGNLTWIGPATGPEMVAGLLDKVYGTPLNTMALTGTSVTTLATIAKTIVPAINELKALIDLLALGGLFVGSFNATASTIVWTVASGQGGNALPAAAAGNRGWYLIADALGSAPPANAPAAAYNIGDWLISDGAAWTRLAFGSALVTLIASAVSVNPAVLGATNVQAALEALVAANTAQDAAGASIDAAQDAAMIAADNLRVLKAGDTMTGGLIAPWITLKQNGSQLNIDTLAAGQQATINFLSGSVGKWQLGQQIDDSFFLYNVATNIVPFSVIGNAVMLNVDPTAPLQAATKQYVDAVGGALGAYVLKAGDTMTGPLSILSNLTVNGVVNVAPGLGIGNAVATGLYGDGGNIALRGYGAGAIYFQMAGGALALGDWDPQRLFVSNPLMLSMDPVQPLQAATKQYVDTVAGAPGAYVLKTGDVMTGTLGTTGIQCRAGQGGGFSGNFFNINWVGGAAELWIDLTNLGPLAIAANYVLKTGDTMSGGLTTTNLVSTTELMAQAGVVRLNAAGSAYMHFDGANINLVGAPVFAASGLTANGFLTVNGNAVVNGTLTSGSLTVNGDANVTGNAAANTLQARQGVVYVDGDAGGGSQVQWRYPGGGGIGGLISCDTTNHFKMYQPATGVELHLASNADLRYCIGATIYCGWDTSLGNIRIIGKGTQAGGGVWAAPSDIRIKTVIGPYRHGLAEVLQLDPVRYRYKGNYKSERDRDFDSPHKSITTKEFVGLVAQDAERVMPEMVSSTLGLIDGKAVDDLRELDATALIYALVNSVKDLSGRLEEALARIETLEAKS